MLTTDKLLRIFIEVIFVLLGGLLVWFGLSGHIINVAYQRHDAKWFAISGFLIGWGLLTLFRGRGQSGNWLRGGSLALLGAILLAISKVPFEYVGKLLAVGGIVLAIRGILGIFLATRQP